MNPRLFIPFSLLTFFATIICLILPQSAICDEPDKPVILFDGKSLGKWKVAEKHMFEDHGKVCVKDGVLCLERGDPATGIKWTGKMPKIDYEISLEARRVDGHDFFCGLTFPINESFCSLIVGGWGGELVGLSNVDFASAADNMTCNFVEFKQNEWVAIRLRVTQEEITVWIDDKKLFDISTSKYKYEIWWEQEPMSPLGISTWHTGSQIRDIRLSKPEKEL